MTKLQKKIYNEIRGCCISDTSAERAAMKAILVIVKSTEHIFHCPAWIPGATCKFNVSDKCNDISCDLTRPREEYMSARKIKPKPAPTKPAPQQHYPKSKIAKLKTALLNGISFSSFTAGEYFGIQHNTFHRLIWQLRQDGVYIKSERVPWKTWKRYWVEK